MKDKVLKWIAIFVIVVFSMSSLSMVVMYFNMDQLKKKRSKKQKNRIENQTNKDKAEKNLDKIINEIDSQTGSQSSWKQNTGQNKNIDMQVSTGQTQ